MKKYDVIIIGAGSAGLGNSGVSKMLGLKTVLIEKDAAHFGGDCTNYGCVPSKAIIHIAHHFHHARKASNFGMEVKGKADMKRVLEYVHQKQEQIRNEEDAEALRKGGQEVIIGEAKFVDSKTIVVNEKLLTARIILLCTGSSPRWIDIPGAENMTIFTNESLFFDCKKLPNNFLVIGGGPIGCEMAQAFQRLGSQVTIVNRGARLLSKETDRISQILEDRFKSEGIVIKANTTVRTLKDGKAILLNKDGTEEEVVCDAALMAIGRVVNVKSMGLEKAGIALTEKGNIKVNAYLQTTNKRVYAIGDAAGTYMFSHGAEKMTRMLWNNLLLPVLKKKNSTRDLSWVTFTDPQIAHFGYTENELQEKGISYFRQDQSFEEDDRAIIQEYEYGFAQYYMESHSRLRNRKLIGGNMIAPQAGELIQEMELAFQANIPIHTINDRVYPYPVAARINQKTIRGVMMPSYTAFKKRVAKMIFRLLHRY